MHYLIRAHNPRSVPQKYKKIEEEHYSKKTISMQYKIHHNFPMLLHTCLKYIVHLQLTTFMNSTLNIHTNLLKLASRTYLTSISCLPFLSFINISIHTIPSSTLTPFQGQSYTLFIYKIKLVWHQKIPTVEENEGDPNTCLMRT